MKINREPTLLVRFFFFLQFTTQKGETRVVTMVYEIIIGFMAGYRANDWRSFPGTRMDVSLQ